MRYLFIPAISLMNRLGYARKFALLWVLFLIAVAVVVASLHASLSKEIRKSERELQGITLAKPLSRAVQILQQHRGLSATLLDGNAEMRELSELRAAREGEASETFAALVRQLPPNLRASAEWSSILDQWSRLREAGMSWSREANFAAHTRLIEQLLFFKVVVSGEYVLPLDPQIDTAYLIDATLNRLPLALEHLGQIRAQGSALLARKQLAELDKVRINTLVAQLDDEVRFLAIDLDRVVDYNPALRARLLAVSGETARLTRQIVDLVAAEIISGRLDARPQDFFRMTTEAIDRGYAQMYQTLLPTIEALIEERIDRAEKVLRTSIGIALLLALIVAYFAIGIYFATAGSIQSLARSARAFAGGNFSERVNLGVRDELRQVGESFNVMADGFSDLLEERKEAEQALKDLSARLEHILASTPAVHYACHLEGERLVPTYASPNLKPLWGYDPAEFLGNADWWASGVHPDERDGVAARLLAALADAGRSKYGHEYRFRHKDGAYRWVYDDLRIIRNVGGEAREIVGAWLDITERKRAEAAIRESEGRYRALFDNMLHGFAHCRMLCEKGQPCDFVFAEVNPAFATLTGLHEVVGRKASEIIPDLRKTNPEIFEIYERVSASDKPERFESYVPALDKWFSASVYRAEEEGGFVAVFDNITERKRAEQALLESGERFRSVIETAMDAMVQMDTSGAITGWNRQAASMFGWSREEAIGRLLHETIIPPRHRESHVRGMKRFFATGASAVLNTRIETEGLHRDGHEFPVELSITAIESAGGYEFSGFIRDITQRKAAEDLIWKQANFDPLSGLPNRRMFHDRLAQEIKRAHRAGVKLALLFIDLDRFKEVNDTLGHSVGDLLLVETARRIAECVRESDTVARFGGDEFLVLLTELDGTLSIERVAECILRKLAQPFRLVGETAYVTASIGITLYPTDAKEVEILIKDADQAMYAAKRMGRNRISYFTAELEQAAQSRRQLTNDLYGALAAGQFRLYYQPIVDLAGGAIIKAEALLRWQHPQRGMVSPTLFIPLAEETGLIAEIGDWVCREAARQLQQWRVRFNPEFQISVNMSPVQFRNDKSCRTWIGYLQELGLPGESMAVEITEGLLLDAEPGVIGRMLEFEATGMHISLDDFGTGYSSLSYLKKFDIDYLKIDQSFIRNLAPGSSDMALTEAIIVMAHKLGMKVIAEGVETEAQRKLLVAAGCDYAQGYLFSQPVPAEGFEALLAGTG